MCVCVSVSGGRSEAGSWEICARWRELGPGWGGPRPGTDRPRCSLDRSGSGRRNGSTCPLLLLPLIPTPITTLPMPLIFSSTSGPLSPKARTPPTTPTLTVMPRTRRRSHPRNRLEENSNMFRYYSSAPFISLGFYWKLIKFKIYGMEISLV